MSNISLDDIATPQPPRLAIGCLFVATAGLALTALSHSKSSGAPSVMPGDPGPYFLAHLSIGALMIAGVLMICAGLRLGGFSLPRADLRRWLQPFLYVVALVGLPIAMSRLGTPTAIAIFALLWISVLMRAAGKSWPSALSTGVVGALAASGFAYVVFIWLLALPLPV